MKKKIVIALIALLVILMLIPSRLQYKDGGTVKYQAVLYSVTKFHRISDVSNVLGADGETDNSPAKIEYIKGTSIKILGIEIYNNTDITDY